MELHLYRRILESMKSARAIFRGGFAIGLVFAAFYCFLRCRHKMILNTKILVIIVMAVQAFLNSNAFHLLSRFQKEV